MGSKYIIGDLYVNDSKVVTEDTLPESSNFSGSYNDLTDKPTIPAEVTVDSALSSASTNPVQNKVINTALGNKVDKVEGKGLSTNDYTTEEKDKLAGIAAGATNVVVDTTLSITSTNAVQNKVIKTALNEKLDSSKQAEMVSCEWGKGNQYIKLSLGKKYAAGQLLLIGEGGISLTLIYTSSKWTAYRHLGTMPYNIYQSADEPEACYLQMSDIAGTLSVRLKPLGLHQAYISDVTMTSTNTLPENATEISLIQLGATDNNVSNSKFTLGTSLLPMNLCGGGNRPKFNDQDLALSTDIQSIAGSVGLSYTSIEGGYRVSGIGTCTDTDIIIPSIYNGKKVTSIGDNAFLDCDSLVSVVIGDSVTSIGTNAFRGCSSLVSVVIPNSVTSIGSFAFQYCSELQYIDIPSRVTTIDNNVFYGCTNLKGIFIPTSVTTLGNNNNVFYGCSNLIVYCEAENQPGTWPTVWATYAKSVHWGCKPGVPVNIRHYINETILGGSW